MMETGASLLFPADPFGWALSRKGPPVRLFIAFLSAVVCVSPLVAQPDPKPAPKPAGKPTEPPPAADLELIMRSMLTAALPNPLIDQKFNWGHQEKSFNGITWEKDGILLKPKKQEKLKNDGTWRSLRVDAIKPDENLTCKVQNISSPEKGKLLFDVIFTLQTRITFQQQVWKSGVRIYSGETRARCRPILGLRCESTSRVVKSDSLLPDVVFRMRVVDAKLSYDQFKVEHTAGVGGELAEMLGNAVHDTMKQVRPSIERNALEKANKAIIKAGDTKEVKLGLGKLFDGK